MKYRFQVIRDIIATQRVDVEVEAPDVQLGHLLAQTMSKQVPQEKWVYCWPPSVKHLDSSVYRSDNGTTN